MYITSMPGHKDILMSIYTAILLVHKKKKWHLIKSNLYYQTPCLTLQITEHPKTFWFSCG